MRALKKFWDLDRRIPGIWIYSVGGVFVLFCLLHKTMTVRVNTPPQQQTEVQIAVRQPTDAGPCALSALLGSLQPSAQCVLCPGTAWEQSRGLFFRCEICQQNEVSLNISWGLSSLSVFVDFIPLLLLPDQVSLCLSQTCQHLEVFSLCFRLYGFVCDRAEVPFIFLTDWGERETALGLWDSLC